MITARPLWGNVLIRPTTHEKKTSSGIILPDTAQQEGSILQGNVITCGSGSIAMDGSPIPMEIQPGAVVIFKKYEAEKVTLNGELMYLVDQRQIIAELRK